MNLEDAVNLVLAEAFAEAGLGSLAEEGGDPGFERVEALKAALSCLHEQLAHEDSLDRQLVSAFSCLAKELRRPLIYEIQRLPGIGRGLFSK